MAKNRKKFNYIMYQVWLVIITGDATMLKTFRYKNVANRFIEKQEPIPGSTYEIREIRNVIVE